MYQPFVPLATKRLDIRALKPIDLAAVFKVLSCKETSGGRVFEKRTLGEAEKWLSKRIADEEELGFSIWAVEDKNGVFVGLCGFLDHEGELELGYIIKAEYQGKGLGTEAATAVLQVAIARGHNVLATIRPSNTKSLCVAEKIGLKRTTEIFAATPELIVFRN